AHATLHLRYATSLLFSYHPPGDHRHLHSFPTRRSSDLHPEKRLVGGQQGVVPQREPQGGGDAGDGVVEPADEGVGRRQPQLAHRSEEHTSELQSRENLVCRLLLEKKKKKTIESITT